MVGHAIRVQQRRGSTDERKLDEADVQVTTVRYDGMIHDFGFLNG